MPPIEIDFDKVLPKRLELSHDLSGFDCSLEDELECNEFLHREDEARLFQKERQGITYLFFYEDTIIGYVTLAMSSIKAQRIDKRYRRPVRLQFYPSLLIGRLGVDNDWREKGVGTHICEWCIGLALELSEIVGCRYVILETNEEKARWYVGRHFCEAERIEDEDEELIWMYQRLDL
jgi:GNAT superfamily N-acetyltransferase